MNTSDTPNDTHVITLPQPWASLVAIGVKTVVVRPYPTSYVGHITIVAHTTSMPVDDSYIRSVLVSAGLSIEALPLGVELATGRLVDCQEITHSNVPCYPEYAFSDFKEGWFQWKLAQIKAIIR